MTRQNLFILITAGIALVAAFVYGDALEEQTETCRKTTADLPKQTIGKDGAAMVLIPAGEFQMGNNDGSGDEKPVHTVYIDDFYMDRYEVTSAQYAEFLNRYEHAMFPSKRYGYSVVRDMNRNILIYIDDSHCPIEWVWDAYIPKAGYENYPATHVTWYGASAYAQYYGKRLPTEAEWEKAARGGLVGKKYPWGDIGPDGTQCNFADRSTRSGWFNEWADRSVHDGHLGTAPVGSYLPNSYGLYDMAGNVWEWCADWYGYYPRSYEENPKGPDSGPRRVVRGGAWNNTPIHLRVAYRYSTRPVRSTGYIGFRCAKNAMP